jgi:hypothetical protein
MGSAMRPFKALRMAINTFLCRIEVSGFLLHRESFGLSPLLRVHWLCSLFRYLPPPTAPPLLLPMPEVPLPAVVPDELEPPPPGVLRPLAGHSVSNAFKSLADYATSQSDIKLAHTLVLLTSPQE